MTPQQRGERRGAPGGGDVPRTAPTWLPRTVLLAALAVAAAALFAYAPVLWNGFLTWDDNHYVTENARVQRVSVANVVWAFTEFHAANWHPLTWLSHMADCAAFGLDPAWHHATSVLLHAMNAALLVVALFKLTGDVAPSALVAALFALHPLNVESVAWLAERKNVLSTLFWILTMLAYARYARRPSRAGYALVLGLFALGLMAKPMLVTLPFVLLLLDVWPLRRLSRRAILEKAPLVALAAASSAITVLAQRSGDAVISTDLVPYDVRLPNAVLSYVRYLAKAAWPSRLSAIYPLPGTPEAPPIGAPALTGALLGLALATVACVRLRRRAPHLLVGWLWYLGTLVPVIGLVQVGGQAMADRYAYVPLIGVFVAAAWSVPAAWWRPRGDGARAVAAGLAAPAALAALGLLVALGARTAVRTRVWRDAGTLWGSTIAAYPSVRGAQADYAAWLIQEGRTGEAIEHLRRALAIDPRFALFHQNLGVALQSEGRLAEAEPALREAVRLDPRSADAHYNLGVVLMQAGAPRAAEAAFREAQRLRPAFAEACVNRGGALARLGRRDEALAALREAVRLSPKGAEAHTNMALAFAALGERAEAAAALRSWMRTAAATPAIEIALAWILATSPEPELRRGAEAVALAERAVAGTGRRDARALDTLAAAYAAAGRFAEARAAAAEALSRSRAAGDERHAPDIAARLALYERGESFLVAGRAQDGEAGAGREPAAP